ncbi:DUF916 domain-containing protein [Catellicoccus marimammalium]|nr:DUF916 domain-containing protein [Catellicoccus marimammalium]
MKKKYKFLLLIGMVFSMFLSTKMIFAGEEDVAKEGFTIARVDNPAQVNTRDTVDSYYLYEKPGTEGEAKIKIINNDARPKKIDLTITDANTNRNGITDYSGTIPNYKLLKTPLTSLVDWKKKTIDLGPNEVRTVTVKFKMPKEKFKGIIAGAINAYEHQGTNNGKQGISMGAKYGYCLGLVLTNTNYQHITEMSALELGDVGPKLDYGRKVIQADIVNPQPYLFVSKKVWGSVKSLDDNKVILKNSMNNVRIAPYQMFPFQFDYGRQDMKPGSYLLVVDVKDKNRTWHFERKFVIKADQAKKINEKSVFKVFIPKWLRYSLLILLIITTIITIYLGFRKPKQLEEAQEQTTEEVETTSTDNK